MKVLLIHPPTSSQQFEPPLGIAYVGAYLVENGHDVEIIDMDPQGFGVDEILQKLSTASPQLVGISFMTSQYGYARELSTAIKASFPNITLVLGGIHVTALPTESLVELKPDFIVLGEGELTLNSLVNHLESGAPFLSEIPGIAFLGDDGQPKLTTPHKLIPDIDSLPIPLWSKLPVGSYRYTPVLYDAKEVEFFAVMTSRGCPNRCNFCASETIYGRTLRYRAPERVIEEVEHLVTNYSAQFINFLDDTITVNRNHLHRILDLLLEKGLAIKWRCTARVNTIDRELLVKMKRAGCYLISYGIESGDPEVLKTINKRISLEQARIAIALTKEAGILSFALFMVGNLGETKESIQKTRRFIKELDADFVSCAILTPYPGTEIYRICKENNWIRVGDWSKYIPSPHNERNFRPVAVVGTITEKDLLKGYYSVLRAFIYQKFRRRYGRLFFLNSVFIRNEVIKRVFLGGPANLIRLIKKLTVG